MCFSVHVLGHSWNYTVSGTFFMVLRSVPLNDFWQWLQKCPSSYFHCTLSFSLSELVALSLQLKTPMTFPFEAMGQSGVRLAEDTVEPPQGVNSGVARALLPFCLPVGALHGNSSSPHHPLEPCGSQPATVNEIGQLQGHKPSPHPSGPWWRLHFTCSSLWVSPSHVVGVVLGHIPAFTHGSLC